MYKYGPRNKEGKPDYVIRSFDSRRIDISADSPKDKAYQDLMKWIIAGNVPEKPEEVIFEEKKEEVFEEEKTSID